MNSWADLSAPLRDEIRNVDAECIIGPSILGAKTGKKEEKLKYLFFFFLLLCSFSQRKRRRSAANEFECVCMKYDVMWGGRGPHLSIPSFATPLQLLPTILRFCMMWIAEGREREKEEAERAGKLTPPLLYFIIIFVFWEKGRKREKEGMHSPPFKNHQNQNRRPCLIMRFYLNYRES